MTRYPKWMSVLALIAATGGQAWAADFNIAESRKSVVYIRSLSVGYSMREGSGFIISKDGLIFTNRHVVMADVIDLGSAGQVAPTPPARAGTTSPATRAGSGTITIIPSNPRGPTTVPATRGTTPATRSATTVPATRGSTPATVPATARGTAPTTTSAKASTAAPTPIVVVGVQSAKDPDTLEFFKADVIYSSPDKDPLDFAVLKIAAKSGYGDFRPMPLNYGKLDLGAAVAAMGFPGVQEDLPSISFTKGTVSTSSRKFDSVNYCQTDAAINPGNSGGPLLNTAGEAVGIVTAKKLDAENIGFALYLNQVQAISDRVTKPTSLVLSLSRPEPGPLNSQNIPLMDGIAATAANWKVESAKLTENKHSMVLENSGTYYMVSSKRVLPAAFQLNIPCMVAPVTTAGGPRTDEISVRFATENTSAMPNAAVGYEVRWSDGGLFLYREGTQQPVVIQSIPVPDEPMQLSIVYKDGALLVACDELPLITYKDPKPLSAKTRLCIGGFQSKMIMGKIELVDLTTAAPLVLPPVIVPKGLRGYSPPPRVVILQPPGGTTPGTPGVTPGRRGTPVTPGTPTIPGIPGVTPGNRGAGGAGGMGGRG